MDHGPMGAGGEPGPSVAAESLGGGRRAELRDWGHRCQPGVKVPWGGLVLGSTVKSGAHSTLFPQ